MPLTDTNVRSVKAGEKPRKISDGGGLHLLVNPTGSKLWRMAYRFEGRQKLLSFGAYPAVSLRIPERKGMKRKRYWLRTSILQEFPNWRK